jgi:hypothetical protein
VDQTNWRGCLLAGGSDKRATDASPLKVSCYREVTDDALTVSAADFQADDRHDRPLGSEAHQLRIGVRCVSG